MLFQTAVRLATYGVAAGVIGIATASIVHAGIAVVPEINPGTVTGALGLLTGGVLILRARRRSK